MCEGRRVEGVAAPKLTRRRRGGARRRRRGLTRLRWLPMELGGWQGGVRQGRLSSPPILRHLGAPLDHHPAK